MNFMKRACLYLARKKGRTALMFLLLFLMSLSVLVGVSFEESAQKELERLRRSMESGFVLKVDTQNDLYRGLVDYGNGLSEYGYAGPKITEELIDKILSVDGVKDYVAPLMGTVCPNLTLRPGAWAASEPDENIGEEEMEVCRNTTELYYCRNGELDKNFRTGALAVRDGRNLREGDRFKVVVSDWLAEENGLSLGDTVTLETKQGNYGPSDHPSKTLGEPVNAEVVGLFHANFSQEPSENTFESCYIDNVIYADMQTAARLRENVRQAGYKNAQEDGYIKVEFFVEDPGKLDSVMRQIEGRGDIDLENMEIEADDTDYRAAANSYGQIRFFAMAFLTSGLCGTGAILYLALRLWAQGRAREAGILFSVGVKKREFLGQMLAECLAVSAAALALAFLLSGPVINQCAGAVERMAAPKAGAEEYEVKIEGFQPVIMKALSDEVTLGRAVSPGTAGLAALFVCGVSCVSVILSYVKISGMEPRKLLQSM